MKTHASDINPAAPMDSSMWAPITELARCFHCSVAAMHKWGRNGLFGYRQAGPRLFLVYIPEAIRFYQSKYPGIEINHEVIDSLMQSSA